MEHPTYLVRHGQSEWNVRRLTQGQTRHPRLTARGVEQAERAAVVVADDLASLGLRGHRVVSSDLTRAVETAEVLARHLGGRVTLDARLREQHLGDLEGRSYEETWAFADTVDWSDPWAPVAGGECLMEVYERMGAALEHHRVGGVSVLVSHGDAIRAVVARLAGVLPHEAPWVEVPNGAVARVLDGVTWLTPAGGGG
ncbi:2,3-diphosphoglycerate-dependent phosphoglycerate mutase GpmB [Nocardioides korecus]